MTVTLKSRPHPLRPGLTWSLWREDGKVEAGGFSSEQEARSYAAEFGLVIR